MKKNFFLTLLPIFLLVCTHLTAQTKQPKPKADPPKSAKKDDKKPQKGQSEDVQVFDQAKAKDDYDYFEKKKNSNPQNIVKLAPLELIDGTFPIFYERVLSPKFSVEIGVGVTATSESFSTLRAELSGNTEYDNYYKGSTGSFIRIGAKYYAGRSDDAPEGPYVGAEFQIKKFKFDSYKLDATGYPSSSAPYQATSVTNTDLIRIVFGYQSLTSSDFAWDYYIGLAWRQHTFNGQYKDDNSKVILGDVTSYKPVFVIGAKIGLGF
jgi:hypothetical protein